MRIILLSNPTPVQKENELINSLFEKGLNYFHLRKPELTKAGLENFLKGLNPASYRKISIHSHYSLIEKYNLGGVHLPGDVQKAAEAKEIIKIAKKRGLRVSASIHSLAEIPLSSQFDYVFISPVFDSISKPGYTSSIDLEEVKKVKASGNFKTKLIALGGVDSETIPSLLNAGFDGAALLGAVWKKFEEENDLQKSVEKFMQILSKVAALSKA